jgi:hypothetical protein
MGLYAHAAFGDAFEGLSDAVQDLKKKHPENYAGHPKAKLLKRILARSSTSNPRAHCPALS